uniref:Eukaryotic translation initiation factor 4E binding protein 3 n=1 Tax=Hucho hucho TaxID=62062 RepID=A0A4W5QIW2_9TELE
MSSNCNSSIGLNCPIPSRFEQSKDWSQQPDSYSQTPGGTLFSTTPGGTRIIYDRKFLLECRNSPIARTPPHAASPISQGSRCLPCTLWARKVMSSKLTCVLSSVPTADDAQFVIDI